MFSKIIKHAVMMSTLRIDYGVVKQEDIAAHRSGGVTRFSRFLFLMKLSWNLETEVGRNRCQLLWYSTKLQFK